MSGAQPFSARAAIGLVAVGAAAFVALLYAIGAGLTGGGNDGGSHALSKGLTGYAALAALLEGSGREVRRSRAETGFTAPGLLVLTPPHDAEGDAVAGIVAGRRHIGPTLVVLPKWVTFPAQGGTARAGWTQTAGTRRARWIGALDDRLDVQLGRSAGADFGNGTAKIALPAPTAAQSLTSKEDAALGLVRGDGDSLLVAYLNDDGSYPSLDRWSGWDPPAKPDGTLFPVVIVAEPDLLDNQGLASRPAALAALALVRRIAARDQPVIFDVTLNGLGRARNLLTLAFAPPFLAATLALSMAALVAGWRAFARFGPARLRPRAIAHGKATLVANSAGLIRRAGRIRLLGTHYAALVAQRLERALGLPADSDVSALRAALDRHGSIPAAFADATAALRHARKPHDLIRAAGALHAIERDLSR